MENIGPVQLLVLGFTHGNFHGQIKAELDRLREHDTIRLLDLAFIRKDENGNVDRLQASDLSSEDAEQFGSLVGALIGLGMAGEDGAEAGSVAGAEAGADGHLLPDDMWSIDDVLKEGDAAAVALIEHRWAIGLREAIRDAGGFHLADAWVHPLDLVAVGLMGAEDAEQQIFERT
jgi:uncharacterized membrane protein